VTPVTRRVGTIVVVGLLTGVITQLAQGVLPDGASAVANTISPWLLIAFLLGSTMPDRRWAAAAGVAALVLALVGYYGTIQIRFGYGGGTGSLLFWSIGSLVGGVVNGVAGREWRGGPPRHRAAAIGLMAAVFIAEGLYLSRIRPELVAPGVGFIVAGAVMPLLLGRSWTERATGYVATLPALLLGGLGYVVFLTLNDITAGIA
jgi:hypothetical protein